MGNVRKGCCRNFCAAFCIFRKILKKSLTGKILVDIMRERAKIRKFFLCAKKFIHEDE